MVSRSKDDTSLFTLSNQTTIFAEFLKLACEEINGKLEVEDKHKMEEKKNHMSISKIIIFLNSHQLHSFVYECLF